MKRCTLATVVAFFVLLSGTAVSDEFKPGILFLGLKFDKSFNQAAYDGARQFEAETGIPVLESAPQKYPDVKDEIRKLADQDADIVAVTGFHLAAPLNIVAKEYPKTKFVIIDGIVDLPNVRSVQFKENEGSFLVGMAAALTSNTGKIGFIGGIRVPVILKFLIGYTQGAKFVNPDIEILEDYVGKNPAAWNNPDKAQELAENQIDQGADVIFAAAGASGTGVIEAAAVAGTLAIGVDSNQNYLKPGTILTSMVKHVDRAVYNAFMDAKNDTWTSGLQILGVAQDGVGWSLDEFNRDLISASVESKIEQARKDIIDGKIEVKGYEAN